MDNYHESIDRSAPITKEQMVRIQRMIRKKARNRELLNDPNQILSHYKISKKAPRRIDLRHLRRGNGTERIKHAKMQWSANEPYNIDKRYNDNNNNDDDDDMDNNSSLRDIAFKRMALHQYLRQRKQKQLLTVHIDFTCERDVFRSTIGDSCYIIPLMFWIKVFF